MDATRRFSNRVDNYVRFRPGYPADLVRAIAEAGVLTAASVVADIGSGTGISAAALLEIGCTVLAVEPNDAMRGAAERQLAGRPGYRSVRGTAEATSLPPQSVDLVAAGQAFHWFDREASRSEFLRILKPAGHVALFWNERVLDGEFAAGYERLLETHGTDYREVTHQRIDAAGLQAFFGRPPATRVFRHAQHFDLEGLTGRLLSSSYAPAAGHPGHEPMLEALADLFRRCQHDGLVTFTYDATLYIGRPLVPRPAGAGGSR
jgi:SAM-dependent methyltransferase